MKHYQVRQYKKDDAPIWNTFISKAKNATFLFNRNFMDYHSNRFDDFSLLIFNESDTLIAVLPANKTETILHSHQGLSYGGLVLNYKLRLADCIEIVKTILKFLNENSIDLLRVKLLPRIYASHFSDELEYALFICKSKVYQKDSLSVIDLQSNYKIASNRVEGVKKGIKNLLEIKSDIENLKLFWNLVLVPNLIQKHQSNPVHSLEEIQLLQSNFPQNIHFFSVLHDNKVVAGCVVFETEKVAHMQYISGNETKNENGSLDYLHHYLITNRFKNKNYFDFGNSNENKGLNINTGLLYWKETFGARTLVQDYVEVETKNYKLLDAVLL